MENELNIFYEFFFFISFSLYWKPCSGNVVQIIVSNKSYGCVDGIHVKEIVKNSYFECFPAILYLSFIRYHPVEMVMCLSREGDKVPMHVRKTK